LARIQYRHWVSEYWAWEGEEEEEDVVSLKQARDSHDSILSEGEVEEGA
jgi:hypothetical protein